MALLGRESELTACLAAFRDSQTPSGIVIAGEPGVGKTALFGRWSTLRLRRSGVSS
jgi:Cdc6-like AAA superfamily ATPase